MKLGLQLATVYHRIFFLLVFINISVSSFCPFSFAPFEDYI